MGSLTNSFEYRFPKESFTLLTTPSLDLYESSLRRLEIDAKCFPRVSSLQFSFLSSLRSLTIVDESFRGKRRGKFILKDTKVLENVSIGSNCFDNVSHFELHSKNSFAILV